MPAGDVGEREGKGYADLYLRVWWYRREVPFQLEEPVLEEEISQEDAFPLLCTQSPFFAFRVWAPRAALVWQAVCPGSRAQGWVPPVAHLHLSCQVMSVQFGPIPAHDRSSQSQPRPWLQLAAMMLAHSEAPAVAFCLLGASECTDAGCSDPLCTDGDQIVRLA